jgi:hypothetical protein
MNNTNKLLTEIESLFKDTSSTTKRKTTSSPTSSIPALGLAVAVTTTTAMSVKKSRLEAREALKAADRSG